MNIATFTMKVRVLNVPDLSGLWACEWHGSRFPIPLQFLLGEHLRLTVWIDDGTDFRWHLQSIQKWKIYIKMINCSSPLPPLQSTPQMELGSILLGVQNREPKIKKGLRLILYTTVHHPPPWPHQCSLHKLRVSTPSQAPSSRQGSNPPWGLCGIPRSLFSYDLCVWLETIDALTWRQRWVYDGRWWWQWSDIQVREVQAPRGSPCQAVEEYHLLQSPWAALLTPPS